MTTPPRHALMLETISLDIPPSALQAYESALLATCGSVGTFLDETTSLWRVEGVKDQASNNPELAAALALADLLTGQHPIPRRTPTPADDWLARTAAAFPEQRIGRRFTLRGTHLPPSRSPGRITLRIDAGVAFGSGEHGSTRGCLRALEHIAHRRPARILDLGCGSGVLAFAAARLLHRPALAADIDPWAVRATRRNARQNSLGPRIRAIHATGYRSPAIAAASPFDLIFANILARPLCAMATDLAAHLAPGGTAILSGLLASQARMVLAAHRRAGLIPHLTLREGDWTTLVLRRNYSKPSHAT